MASATHCLKIVRYLLLIGCVIALLIGGLGHLIYKRQRAEAERGATELRPYIARVERTEPYRCKGICYRSMVSYAANGSQQLSKFSESSPVLVGQTLTVWAKPNFEYAYTSPQAYLAKAMPLWSPTSLLFLPLLAIFGAVANTKLDRWRKS